MEVISPCASYHPLMVWLEAGDHELVINVANAVGADRRGLLPFKINVDLWKLCLPSKKEDCIGAGFAYAAHNLLSR